MVELDCDFSHSHILQQGGKDVCKPRKSLEGDGTITYSYRGWDFDDFSPFTSVSVFYLDVLILQGTMWLL